MFRKALNASAGEFRRISKVHALYMYMGVLAPSLHRVYQLSDRVCAVSPSPVVLWQTSVMLDVRKPIFVTTYQHANSFFL